VLSFGRLTDVAVLVASTVIVEVAPDVAPVSCNAPVSPLPTPLLTDPGQDSAPLANVQPANRLASALMVQVPEFEGVQPAPVTSISFAVPAMVRFPPPPPPPPLLITV
jgi:hypothetical protein